MIILWTLLCVLVGAGISALALWLVVVRPERSRHAAELDASERRRAEQVARLAARQVEDRHWKHHAPTVRP